MTPTPTDPTLRRLPPRPPHATPAQGEPRERGRLVRVPLDFLEKMERVLRLHDRLDVLMDDLFQDLSQGRAIHRPEDVAAANRSPAPRRGRPRLVPPVWIKSLATRPRPDGTLLVEVDGDRFVLQPHLGALLLALADDTGTSYDEGIGFKTLGDLSVRMAKRLGGTPLSSATVNKYVYKLRQVLQRRAGLPSGVIQTNRRLGRRLAVRRPKATLPAP